MGTMGGLGDTGMQDYLDREGPTAERHLGVAED